MNYPKRLIEVDLPIKRISAHARREKSIRHGHISTLHIWWARRPLAACRAVICAALWPDPADPLCPQAFRDAAATVLTRFAGQVTTGRELATSCPDTFSKWMALTKSAVPLNPIHEKHWITMRGLLLDFIADFANWDNSTREAYLEASRALTKAAHEALGGLPGTRPLVADPFAGGGAIPLEALRVGADAFASDLNPVAVLLNKVVLEYIPKYGQGLADDVRKWGQWVKIEAEKELAAFYPKDPDRATPIAYMWARTITCEGPSCGAEVPLVRSLWLAKKDSKSVALRVVPNFEAKRVDFEIIEGTKTKGTGEGIVRRGAATCPVCGYTTPVASVRRQLKTRNGGTKDAKLVAVVTTHGNVQGRFYRLPTDVDLHVSHAAASALARCEEVDTSSIVPYEPTPEGKGAGAGRAFSQRNYGMDTFADLYTSRQLLMLSTLARIIRDARDTEMPQAVRVILALALGRVNDLSMSLCRWLPSLEAVASANGGQNRMPVVLDFVEANPFGGSGGDWLGQIDWIARVVEHLQASKLAQGVAVRSPAQIPTLPDDSADAFITDPPYYDAFPYSDLSDFFFIWLKRSIGGSALGYEGNLVPKDEEAVVYDVVHGGSEIKDRDFFQREMTVAFRGWRSVAKPNSIGVVVFANKTTGGWESLIQGIIDAGWVVTGSWPIDTERPNRQRAIDSAALGSSVHLICRPREHADGSLRVNEIGDWRDILTELPRRIHEWMPRLALEGVVGADAIFACLGPALEVFSRYSHVEKASGEHVLLRDYLENVWAAVAREALNMIFEGADATGFEEDARLTAMWLWTLSTGGDNEESASDDVVDDEETTERRTKQVGGFSLEYDAARKIAQGLGAHIEELDHLVEVSGETARLLPVSARMHYLFGKDETATPIGMKRKATTAQMSFDSFEDEMKEAYGEWGEKSVPKLGHTALDRVHQAMILFAAGRSEALKRFLVVEGAGQDIRFWRLAQALSALYSNQSDEKRWVDGVLARKKNLGF